MLIKSTNTIMYTNNTEFKNENVNSTTSALLKYDEALQVSNRMILNFAI